MLNPDRIVSSEAEELILVDEEDRETGYSSKADCHDGEGRLHRAFSVFLFNAGGELLIQQRADGKRLWPGFWSNTCCSHPRRGETIELASERRLADELNISTELEFVYKFIYRASFGEAGSEYEYCHVFIGHVNGDPRANVNEIAAIRFVSPAALEAEFAGDPGRFTPWFKLEWEALRTKYRDALGRYAEL